MVRILTSVAIALVLLLQPAAAQRDRDRRPDRPDAAEVDREVLLGEKSVGFRVDRDTINIPSDPSASTPIATTCI